MIEGRGEGEGGQDERCDVFKPVPVHGYPMGEGE